MKKLMILVLFLDLTGCTTMALEHHIVSQSQSAADYRYHAALDCLAMVAADPGTLPSYALLSSGVTSITNTGMVNPVTGWKGSPLVFTSEAVAVTGTHTPQVQWTVSPVADHTQLEAMRGACRWVLSGGPEHLDPDSIHILADPVADLSPGPHFGVADRLTRLPHQWLNVGKLRDVPVGACYKAHHGDTWVWVMPDGIEGLAGFTLVLQDIATLNVAPPDNSLPANRTPPLLVTLWVTQNALRPVVIDIKKEGGAIHFDPTDVKVGIGQYVVWRNMTPEKITVSSFKKDAKEDKKKVDAQDDKKKTDDKLFQVTIEGWSAMDKAPASKGLLFDQDIFKNSGTILGQDSVRIEYRSGTEKDKGTAGALTLFVDPNRSAYAATTVFRVDREIKPEFKHAIEQAMIQGMSVKGALPQVNISWDQWMAMTTPYQGARTSVKPGSVPVTPILVPNSRQALPPAILAPQLNPALWKLGPSPNNPPPEVLPDVPKMK
jgi:hypothetical protein